VNCKCLSCVTLPHNFAVVVPTHFRGQDGWNLKVKKVTKAITLAAWVSYMLMARKDKSGNIVKNPIHLANRLGEQYIVDQWAKVEGDRLRFFRFNQKQCRADLYKSVQDAVYKGDDAHQVDLEKIGTPVPTILPGTHTGSDRYMHQQYQDAMAICRRYGKPHLFVTMTCNPDWKEIKDQLEKGQNALNRPDLCCRVFKLKLDMLMKDFKDRHVFGKVKAHVYSIEFQKRGFPHAHILFWFEDKHHLTIENIDRIISAEIPDKKDPIYDRVTKSMIHGPKCKARGFSCCDNINKMCKNGYPHRYETETTLDEDNYPRYRRRSPEDGGNFFYKYINQVRTKVTNADVVPHSPWLIKKYDCHINVEYVHSVRSLKYVFKYIMKGSDQANVTVEKATNATGESQETNVEVAQARDEIKDYESKRYVSSVEACWRLLKYPIVERSPNVEALKVHVPGEQQIRFTPDPNTDRAEAEEMLIDCSRTTLTEYFRMCREKKGGAEELYYHQMPEKFTWNATKKEWKPRQRGFAIGRMHQAHPSNVERYHLRLLLNRIKGATSFEHLKTLDDGSVCNTFLEACIKRHLTKDDLHWYDAMDEAVHTTTNMYQLRAFFVDILTQNQVGDPLKLYNHYKDSMRDDYNRRFEEAFHGRVVPQKEPDQASDIDSEAWDVDMIAANASLCDIHERFKSQEKSAGNYGLPHPDFERDEFYQAYLDNRREAMIIKEKARQFYLENIDKLNTGQRRVYNRIKERLENNEGGLVFLDAPGGTGKTFTLNVLAGDIRRNDGIVASTAFSGIAATLLHEGRTSNGMFKIPCKIFDEGTRCNIRLQSNLAKFLRDMDLGIIDEGPMMNKLSFECLDRTLRGLTGNHNKKFGGKLILVSGDFRQMLPVVERGNRAAVVNKCLKSSNDLWDDDVEILRLTENMRVQKYIEQYPDDTDFHTELREFEKWLLKLGDGKASVSKSKKHDGVVKIPHQMTRDSSEDVMDDVYGDLRDNVGNKQYLKSRMILAADNTIVNETNIEMVQKLPGELHTFKSVDTVDNDDQRLEYPVDYLNLLNPSGLSEHELHLKVGAPVILLRNFNVKAGHCNGTRYIVKEIYKHRLELEKLDANGNEDDILQLPRISMRYDPDDQPLTMTRLQFPIKPAFAVTFHRSQGQSVEKCGILLPRDVWTHGQIYVAFSRCGNPRNVCVWAEQDQFKDMGLDSTCKYMKNVVWTEVLRG